MKWSSWWFWHLGSLVGMKSGIFVSLNEVETIRSSSWLSRLERWLRVCVVRNVTTQYFFPVGLDSFIHRCAISFSYLVAHRKGHWRVEKNIRKRAVRPSYKTLKRICPWSLWLFLRPLRQIAFLNRCYNKNRIQWVCVHFTMYLIHLILCTGKNTLKQKHYRSVIKRRFWREENNSTDVTWGLHLRKMSNRERGCHTTRAGVFPSRTLLHLPYSKTQLQLRMGDEKLYTVLTWTTITYVLYNFPCPINLVRVGVLR